VILPNLRFTEIQLENFKDNTIEFNNEIKDQVEEWDNKTLKNKLSIILWNLCKNIDGCLPKIIEFFNMLLCQISKQDSLENYHQLKSL